MKINLILLAAGNSQRFEQNKLLVYYQGQPIYQYALSLAQKCHCTKKILVTQYQQIRDTPFATDFFVVENPYPQRGLSYSIRLGILADMQADGYCFLVCDQPKLTLTTLEKLLETFQLQQKGIVCAAYGDRTGNPVIFSKKYVEELLHLQGDIGGKQIVKRHLEDVAFVQVQQREELFDIDTPNDLKSIRKL